MAITLSDKNRFRLGPNLFVPGMPPVGNVAINWSHPAARGLRLCLLPGRELVRGLPPNEARGTIKFASGKRGIDGDTSDKYTTTSPILKIGEDYTFFSHFYNGSVAAQESPLIELYGDGGNFKELSSHYDGGRWYLYMKDGYGIGQILTTTYRTSVQNEAHTLCACSDDAGNAEIYFNGRQENTATSSAFGTDSEILDFHALGDSASGNAQGDVVFCGYVFARKLSADEIMRLHRDPYQFLEAD